MLFLRQQLPLCLKKADFSVFWGCCTVWQVAAEPSCCYKLCKIDQQLGKYHINASRKYSIDKCFHFLVAAFCSNFR